MPGSLTNNFAALLMLTAIKQIWVVKIAIHMVKFYVTQNIFCNSPFRVPKIRFPPGRPPDPTSGGNDAPSHIFPTHKHLSI